MNKIALTRRPTGLRNLFSRLAFLPALMLLGLFLSASPAFAQTNPFQPKFDPRTSVYVDPALTSGAHSVNVSGLASQLEKLVSSQGAHFYFVFEQKDPTVKLPARYGIEYGAWALDDLVSAWSGQPGFPAGDAVVIILVRSDKNVNAFSYAANAGSKWQAFGLTKDYFKQALPPIKQQYLPNDPIGYAVAVATNVNGHVAGVIQDRANQAQAAQQEAERQAQAAKDQAAQEAAHRAFMARLPMYILIVLLLGGIVGALVFLTIRLSSIKSKLAAIIAKWTPELDNCNAAFLKLQKEYMDFLTDQKGRRGKFKGTTLASYNAALASYTDFSIRRQVANDLLEKARKALASGGLFSVAGMQSAYDSLTSTKVVITGQEIELKNLTDVFGGLVQKTEFEPSELLANINNLFTSTNSALAAIYSAFGTAATNRTAISTALGEIDAMKPKLTEAELTFDPYAASYTSISGEAATTLADIASDPLAALADSQRIAGQVSELKTHLQTAITVKKSLSETVTAIGKIKTAVTGLRGQSVGFAFPGVAAPASANFLLNEEGGNPDGDIAQADQHLAAANAAVLGGDIAKAKAEKAAAEAAAASATETVAHVQAAKAAVEKTVTPVHTNLTTLKSELGSAGQALAALQADFLPKNFADKPAKLTGAQHVADTTESQVAAVQQAYFEQRFLSARQQIAAIGGGVQSARDALVEIHSRLSELGNLRTHAKETSAAAVTSSNALARKRQAKSFTTASATDGAHEELMHRVTALAGAVNAPMADWPALASNADDITAALHKIDETVDEQEGAHTLAQSRVAAVEAAVATAASFCNDNDVRQPARQALATAQSAVRQLDGQLQIAKSDWAAIARDAESKKDVADSATALAQTDKRDAANAREAIAQAQSAISSADRSYRTSSMIGGSLLWFGDNVGCDLSSAESELSAATRALSSQDYSAASSYAQRAQSDAAQAQERAEAQVQQMIAIQVGIWEAEQQRLREEEEARQQAIRDEEARQERARQEEQDRQDRARREEDDRNASSGGGTDFGGSSGFSGGSSDSDSSTGNSGGGTDSGF